MEPCEGDNATKGNMEAGLMRSECRQGQHGMRPYKGENAANNNKVQDLMKERMLPWAIRCVTL